MIENCEAKINGECMACDGTGIINKGTSSEEPCPICKKKVEG